MTFDMSVVQIAKQKAEEARKAAEAEVARKKAEENRDRDHLKRMKAFIAKELRAVEEAIPGFTTDGVNLSHHGKVLVQTDVVEKMVPEEWTDSLHPPLECRKVYLLETPGCTVPRYGFGSQPLEVPTYVHFEHFKHALADFLARYI